MFKLGSEEYPTYNPSLYVREATDTEPVTLGATMSQAYLTQISDMALGRVGVSIYELAKENPRDAYVRVSYLFAKKFIDTRDGNWGIGSAEEDGQQAFDGLERYVEERKPPDPDIEEIDVILSVWKRPSLFARLKGKKYSSEEILRFRTGPQDLAFH